MKIAMAECSGEERAKRRPGVLDGVQGVRNGDNVKLGVFVEAIICEVQVDDEE